MSIITLTFKNKLWKEILSSIKVTLAVTLLLHNISNVIVSLTIYYKRKNIKDKCEDIIKIRNNFILINKNLSFRKKTKGIRHILLYTFICLLQYFNFQ